MGIIDSSNNFKSGTNKITARTRRVDMHVARKYSHTLDDCWKRFSLLSGPFWCSDSSHANQYFFLFLIMATSHTKQGWVTALLWLHRGFPHFHWKCQVLFASVKVKVGLFNIISSPHLSLCVEWLPRMEKLGWLSCNAIPNRGGVLMAETKDRASAPNLPRVRVHPAPLHRVPTWVVHALFSGKFHKLYYYSHMITHEST